MKKKITLKDLLETIRKWSIDNNAVFYGSFVSFDKGGKYKDGTNICFGDKETLSILKEDFDEKFENEKGDFINW